MAKSPKTRKPRAAKKAPPANGSKVGGNGEPPVLSFDEERALFLRHRKLIEDQEAKVAAIKLVLDGLYADAKVDGKFTKEEFRIARDLAASPKREAKVAGDVRKRLRVARFIGHPMGRQFDLFEQPDRTPAVESAYDAGKQASMENRPRRPPHAPEVPQYEEWMRGYNDHQATLAAAFKRTPQTGSDGEPIKSGTFVPRSAFSKAALEAGATGAGSDPRPEPPVDQPEPSPLPAAAQGESEL